MRQTLEATPDLGTTNLIAFVSIFGMDFFVGIDLFFSVYAQNYGRRCGEDFCGATIVLSAGF